MNRRVPLGKPSGRTAFSSQYIPRPSFERRPSSTASFATTVARSSRSDASSATGARDSATTSVSLPLTLYEYGFPEGPARPLPSGTVFTDERGRAFMSSPAGTQLRSLERGYSRVVNQYVVRSIPLASARVLVLGAGSSRSVASLLSRGVLSATFVDLSQRALDALSANLDQTGVVASTQVEYVCDDAWSFLATSEADSYDLILAVKCVGLILSSGPARTTVDFLDYVVDALAPNGSFVTDQHEAFSTPAWEGKPVAVGMTNELYDLATIAGRYSADVGYSWDVNHPDVDRVCEFRPHSTPHDVQAWRVVHFRVVPAAGPPPVRVISSRVQRVPALITPTPPSHAFDSVLDAMLPVNAKGVKRITSHFDMGGYDRGRARPKIDGHSGLLSLDGSTAVFVSPTRSFAIPLPIDVTPPLVMTSEFTTPEGGGSLVVATGVVSIGESRTDPNDLSVLLTVAPHIEALAQVGIIANTPDLLKSLVANAIRLVGKDGRLVVVPVDGLSVSVGSFSAIFIKPLSMCTVDATGPDVVKLLHAASAALGAPPPDVTPPPGPGVWEFSYDVSGSRWYPVRARTDKTWSDSVGATIHTMTAASRAYQNGLAGTVEAVAAKILA